jgi:hypothetical protein
MYRSPKNTYARVNWYCHIGAPVGLHWSPKRAAPDQTWLAERALGMVLGSSHR